MPLTGQRMRSKPRAQEVGGIARSRDSGRRSRQLRQRPGHQCPGLMCTVCSLSVLPLDLDSLQECSTAPACPASIAFLHEHALQLSTERHLAFLGETVLTHR